MPENWNILWNKPEIEKKDENKNEKSFFYILWYQKINASIFFVELGFLILELKSKSKIKRK